MAEERIRAVLGDLGSPDVTNDRERVETVERARELEFAGSPTVLIDGADHSWTRAGHRTEVFCVNHKRIQRICRDEGLQVTHRGKKHARNWRLGRAGRPIAVEPPR